MKLLKSLRRRKPRPANPDKVIRGFVRALGELRPAMLANPQPNTRSKT
ncbi:MAG: hypothetical protein Q8M31_13890 [Beijerinckiaceae bacterium]|nr:hypothetical protein [Beijerinckiaceae bacterium]